MDTGRANQDVTDSIASIGPGGRVARQKAGSGKHLLPPLPYEPAALEPHIDARTMLLHHDKHHASYVENLNSALEKFPELQERTAFWLLLNLGKVPQEIRSAVRNNAGGHVNHSLFWRAMSPAARGAPAGPLADAIKRDFGGFERFKARFDDAGAKLFGSGWVWLARAQQDGGGLEVYTTSGHDNPLMQGHFPILVNDVWEHAYYLKHENRRGDYLKGWWPVVNWEEAARRFERSDHSAERDGEGEGGLAAAPKA
jgi:Fe-Mn family superoxide dismutase